MFLYLEYKISGPRTVPKFQSVCGGRNQVRSATGAIVLGTAGTSEQSCEETQSFSYVSDCKADKVSNG